jgi:putative transposase
VKVNQAYRFALDPTPAQERALRSHAGAARFAWNWGLARCRERHEAEGTWYTGIDLHKLWNERKKADPALSWWRENSKCAYQEAFRDLDRALRDFVTSKKGARKGRRLGFPRFKKRGTCRDAFRLTTGALRCAGTTVTLPKLGTIRTHESTRKLARRLGNGTARILSATVSRTAQRWYVSFTVEAGRQVPERHARPGSAIGVDLGVKTLLAGVDDAGNVVTVAGPKALRTSLRKLRRTSRAHSRKKLGSANRRKASARLARVHARAANVRAGALHKATRDLARRYETVVAEDLNVAGMIRNRRLARAVADAGFGAARQMLAYKDGLERRPARDRRPVLPQFQNLLGLRRGESQTAPVRAHLHLHRLRPGPRPGHQRRAEPAPARRQWGGEPKRLRRDCKTRPRRARPGETGTRRRTCG